MKKTIRISIIPCITIIAVWFTSQFGGGWASGAQAYAWFGEHGWMGIWLPLVGMAIISFVGYLAMEFARLTKSYNYNVFMTRLYRRKWVSVVYEILMVIGCIITAGALVASAGGLVVQQLGMNYWIGVVIFALIVAVLCMYGEETVRKSATLMGAIIIALMILIFVIVASQRHEVVSKIISERTVYTSTGSALYYGIRFGFITSAMLVSLLPVMTPLKSRKDSLFVAVGGFIINSLVIIALVYTVLAFMPEIGTATIPLLYAAQNMNLPWLSWVYAVVLMLALITTGVGSLYTFVVRFSPYMKAIKSEKTKALIIIIVIMAIASAVSAVGLYAIVAKGYGFMAYSNLLFVTLGIPIVGGIRLKKLYADEKEAERSQP